MSGLRAAVGMAIGAVAVAAILVATLVPVATPHSLVTGSFFGTAFSADALRWPRGIAKWEPP